MSNQHPSTFERLRREETINFSGVIIGENQIPLLKERDYAVKDFELDGDAPKAFIRVYEFQRDGKVRRSKPHTWVPYIAKTAQKWYPHESVIEYMINRIGQELGLVMNEIKLLRINGQIRFLSKYFRRKDEQLIHGAEICGDHLEDRPFAQQIADDVQLAREFFTFNFIEESLMSVFPSDGKRLLASLVRLLVFDGLTGNNDRHFYNWGVLRPLKKGKRPPRLAPVYDSARGLFWNVSDDKLRTWHELILKDPEFSRFEKYIDSSRPRIGLEQDHGEPDQVNHFKLIQYLKGYNKEYEQIIKELSSPKLERKIITLIKREFARYFIPERNELTIRLLEERFARIREL
jgi:hypothetical protein